MATESLLRAPDAVSFFRENGPMTMIKLGSELIQAEQEEYQLAIAINGISDALTTARRYNNELGFPVGHMLTINGNGPEDLVVAQENPRIITKMVSTVNKYLDFDAIAEFWGIGLEGQQIKLLADYFSGISHTSDLQKESADDTYYQSLTPELKLQALSRMSDMYTGIHHMVNEHFNALQHRPDLSKNVLYKFNSRLSLIRHNELFDQVRKAQREPMSSEALQQEVSQSLTYVSTLAKAFHKMPFLIDLSSHANKYLARLADGIRMNPDGLEKWDIMMLLDINRSRDLPIEAMFKSYDYLKAKLQNSVINGERPETVIVTPEQYSLMTEVGPQTGRLQKTDEVRKQAVRYILAYSHLKLKDTPGIYEEAMQDYIRILNRQSEFIPEEDELLYQLVQSVRRNDADGLRRLAEVLYIGRGGLAENTTLREYNQAVNNSEYGIADAKRIALFISGVELMTPPAVVDEVADPFPHSSYDVEDPVPVKNGFLPFGKKAITKLLSLFPNERRVDDIRRRLKLI